MLKYKLLENKLKLDEIIEIHIKSFPNFFLTSLGEKLLYELYNSFLITKNAGIIIGEYENEIIGFLAFSENNSSIYINLMKNNFIKFLYLYTLLFFKKPKVAFELFYKIVKRNKITVKKYEREKKIRISSIAVAPNYQNRGVAKGMLEEFKKRVEKKYDFIELETDKENNEKTNQFYKKNGFELFREYQVENSRMMNEYRFYFRVNL